MFFFSSHPAPLVSVDHVSAAWQQIFSAYSLLPSPATNSKTNGTSILWAFLPICTHGVVDPHLTVRGKSLRYNRVNDLRGTSTLLPPLSLPAPFLSRSKIPQQPSENSYDAPCESCSLNPAHTWYIVHSPHRKPKIRSGGMISYWGWMICFSPLKSFEAHARGGRG